MCPSVANGWSPAVRCAAGSNLPARPPGFATAKLELPYNGLIIYRILTDSAILAGAVPWNDRNPMRVQSHGAVSRLAEGLYCVEGAFGRSPLGRRMTAVVLPSGRLALHSPIRMTPEGMGALDALGQVAAILIPNRFHWSDAPWYAERYPQAAVLAPGGAQAKLKSRLPMLSTLEDGWSGELGAGLARMPLEGSKTHEYAFFHPASRTLILTDLVFNMGAGSRGLTRILLRLNQAHGRFGPSRLLRWAFTSDKAALISSARKLAQWDYDRVIMSHGDVLELGGKAAMAAAFAEWEEN